MNKKELFFQIQEHLLLDQAPSVYLNLLSEKEIFQEEPFLLIQRLREIPQSPKYHPEGNVWNHTMLVVDEAAKYREKSKNPAAFLWAALLHDIGKADTTKDRKGRITAYNHDSAGAKLAEKFLREFVEDQELIRRIVSLVKWHMQVLFVTKSMQFADIKTMLKETDLQEIALLGYCDRVGRLNADREKERKIVEEFMNQCRAAGLS